MEEKLIDAWAAGIVDGEGCITIKPRCRGRYYMLFVLVAQSGPTLPPMIKRLMEVYGGKLDSPKGYREQRGDRQHRWMWYVIAAEAEAFLRRILPYMIQKRDQAEVAIEYREVAMGRGRSGPAAEFSERLRSFKNYKKRHPKWTNGSVSTEKD